mgnify:CR=1 FL=1
MKNTNKQYYHYVLIYWVDGILKNKIVKVYSLDQNCMHSKINKINNASRVKVFPHIW